MASGRVDHGWPAVVQTDIASLTGRSHFEKTAKPPKAIGLASGGPNRDTTGTMNIGLLGGTFDPIHRGHIALARAAMEKCKLARIYFVTAHVPPHKQLQPLSPFLHRYAMVALATAAEKTFIPSLLEAPEEFSGREPATTVGKGKDKDRTPKPNYTIETVRRLKQGFKASDK